MSGKFYHGHLVVINWETSPEIQRRVSGFEEGEGRYSRLKSTCKVEIGKESFLLFSQSVRGLDFSLGEPLFTSTVFQDLCPRVDLYYYQAPVMFLQKQHLCRPQPSESPRPHLAGIKLAASRKGS